MSLHVQKKYLIGINILGGAAVLFSYIYGLTANPAAAPALWGEVPEAIRPYYTVAMFCAAAGYFLFTGYILFALDVVNVRIAGRFSYQLFNGLYIMILAPSALWMPLTFMMIGEPTLLTWIAVRTVLSATALGSLGLLAALLYVRPRNSAWAHILAVLGSTAFCFQTVLLDALVWTAYFPLKF